MDEVNLVKEKKVTESDIEKAYNSVMLYRLLQLMKNTLRMKENSSNLLRTYLTRNPHNYMTQKISYKVKGKPQLPESHKLQSYCSPLPLCWLFIFSTSKNCNLLKMHSCTHATPNLFSVSKVGGKKKQ